MLNQEIVKEIRTVGGKFIITEKYAYRILSFGFREKLQFYAKSFLRGLEFTLKFHHFNRIQVAETTDMSYVGQNYGPLASTMQQNCKYDFN